MGSYYTISFNQPQDAAVIQPQLLKVVKGAFAVTDSMYILYSDEDEIATVSSKFSSSYTEAQVCPKFMMGAGYNGWQNKMVWDGAKALSPHVDFDAIKSKLSPVEADLNALIGMQQFKDTLEEILSDIKMASLMNAAQLSPMSPSYHALMRGSPGTGKTTAARIYGRALRALGVLAKGDVIEIDRSGLVGSHVGETEIKTNAVLAKAAGNVLFIDEAYSLFADSEGDFGNIAVQQIVKYMEDHRNDIVIIFAGYTHEMENLIGMNSGLQSRFPMVFDFPDYTTPELIQMARAACKKAVLLPCDEFDADLTQIIDAGKAAQGRKFGNGRFVRNLIEHTSRDLAKRLDKEGKLDQPYKADELRALRTIQPVDLRSVAIEICGLQLPERPAPQPAPENAPGPSAQPTP